jgi:ATP-dependent Clp protease protease subunit
MDNNNDNYPHQSLDDQIDRVILDSRRLFLSDMVDNKSSGNIIRKLWYLESIDPGKPILFIINSPGGSVDAGLAIWDQVKLITSPVYTLITGLAASMGSVLSLCATKGKRFATKHARVMIHQPSVSGPIQGQATDLEIHAKEIIKTKDMLVQLYMAHSGKTQEEVEQALDRDTWMTAEEALRFGLLDKIILSYDEIK